MSEMVEIEQKGYLCTRCQHLWVPRSSDEPRVCPKCKSPYWNRPRRNNKNVAALTALFVLLLGVTGFAQTRKEIDWKPCKDVTDKLQATVDQFNAEHKDGFQIMFSCTYSGDPTRQHLPEKKVPLTPSEIETLHALRKIEHAAFAASEQYEDYLFRAHRIHKPKIGDPCYYYVGIVVDEDYITVDPNLLTPWESDCPELRKP